MRIRVAGLTATVVVAAFAILSCGGGSAPASPTTQPNPSVPSPSLPSLNGDWAGTLESSGMPARPIALRLIQQADCVDGGWHTVPLSDSSRWVGAVSAFAKPAALDGFMSFEFQVGARLCTGLGTLVGDATDTTATLKWTITEYDTETCTRGVPHEMTVRLQR